MNDEWALENRRIALGHVMHRNFETTETAVQAATELAAFLNGETPEGSAE